MTWYSIENLKQSKDNGISADVRVPQDSPWFAGHFPGEPILPGIAQLAMVRELISRTCHRKITVAGIRRVRFKQIIRPEDRLAIVVKPMPKNAESYSFRIMLGQQLACSGVMTVESQTDDRKKGMERHNL